MVDGKIPISKEGFLKGFSWFLLGIILVIFLVPLISPDKFCFNSGEYASFVGGLAGPLASLVGFIYVYLTFLGQQRQLDEQRERLNRDEANRLRDEAAKQFAEYLSIWIAIRSNVRYSTGAIGEQAFDDWWGNVKKAAQNDLKTSQIDLSDSNKLSESLSKHFYSKGFNGKNDQYDNFLRVIYLMIEIAQKNDFQDRVKILESFMTRSEKAILIYSAIFIDKNESAIKLFKSGFCQTIPDEFLISPAHRNLIF